MTARLYKCSIPDKNKIKKQVKKLPAVGLIEESTLPFASLTLTFKKNYNCRLRLCNNFRNVNKLIVKVIIFFTMKTINKGKTKVS